MKPEHLSLWLKKTHDERREHEHNLHGDWQSSLANARSPRHARAARFRVLCPGGRIRIEHRVGTRGNENIWLCNPISIHYSTLPGLAGCQPWAEDDASGGLQANRARRRSFPIVPVIGSEGGNEPGLADPKSGRLGSPIVRRTNAQDLEDLFDL